MPSLSQCVGAIFWWWTAADVAAAAGLEGQMTMQLRPQSRPSRRVLYGRILAFFVVATTLAHSSPTTALSW